MATTTAVRDDMLRMGKAQARDDPAVRQQLEAFSRAERLSRSEVMRWAIREFLRPRGFWPPAQTGGAG